MENLINWIQPYIGTFQILMNIIIVLVATIFVGLAIISAISKLRKKNWAEGGAMIGAALVMALIAMLGVVGVNALADAIKPDFVNGNDQFSAASVSTQTVSVNDKDSSVLIG